MKTEQYKLTKLEGQRILACEAADELKQAAEDCMACKRGRLLEDGRVAIPRHLGVVVQNFEIIGRENLREMAEMILMKCRGCKGNTSIVFDVVEEFPYANTLSGRYN